MGSPTANLFTMIVSVSLVPPMQAPVQMVQRAYVAADASGVRDFRLRIDDWGLGIDEFGWSKARFSASNLQSSFVDRQSSASAQSPGGQRGIPGILWTYDDTVHPAPIPESVALSPVTNSAWVAQDLNAQRLQRFLIDGDGTAVMEIPGVTPSEVAVAAAKDADLAVWVSETDTVTITAYNSLSTTPLWSVPIPPPYTNINVHSTRVSRDGAIVCCAVRDNGPPEATMLFILDGATGTELETWDHLDRSEGIDLTDDGSLCLVKQGVNGRLIDTAMGTEVFTGTVTGTGGGWSISGNGEVIVLGGFTEMVVYKKSGSSYTQAIFFEAGNQSFEEVAVSRDGSTVAAMSGNFSTNWLETTTYVFDVPSESLIGQYDTSGTGVRQDVPSAAAVSDDGSVIAVGSWGTQNNDHPEVLVFDRCANLIGSVDTAGSVMALDISGDGAYVLVGSKAVHANVMGSGGSVTMYQVLEPGAPRVIHVDADAPDGGNGISWDTAYNDLQDALDVACSNAQIWGAAGTYKPSKRTDPGNSRSATFQLASGVALYGGFGGGEENLDDRNADPETNGTVLSGDINTAGDDSDNAHTVVTGSDTDETAILDGFTITDGRADGEGWLTPSVAGGGIYNWTGSPTLRNCIIAENMALKGGGVINIDESHPTFRDCVFRNNVTDDGELAPGTFAGGMANLGNSGSVLTDCRFVSNSAPNAGPGGLYISSGGSDTVLHNCLFQGNSAWRGGAVTADGGASPVFDNCRFIENTATTSVPVPQYPPLAGAMFLLGGSPELRDCAFVGNTSSGLGGGLVVAVTNDAALSNCTFHANSAGDLGGGIYAVQSATLTVADSIFWANTDTGGANTDASAQIYDDSLYGANVVSVTYSCVQDHDADDSQVYPGIGNIDDDPLLSDSRPTPGSPCVNTGDPGSVPELDETDLDGNPRLQGCRVDMGAWETDEPQALGDFDGDGDWDLKDFAGFQICLHSELVSHEWLDACLCVFDFDGSDQVDLADYAEFHSALGGP